MSDTLKACEGQNGVIVNETDELARQFHDRYEEIAPLYGYATRNDTRVFDPDSLNGRLMRAVCLQVVGPIIAERDALRDAINALHDYVQGKRHDDKDISEIVNGAMKI